MDLSLAIERVVRSYRDVHPKHRYYVRAKLPTDPLTKELAELAKNHSLGDTVDAGCGRGQYGKLLAELGAVRSLFAFDHDEDKILAGSSAGWGEGTREKLNSVEFEQGLLEEQALPRADTFLFLDVLHYITIEAQDELLSRAVKQLNEGGRIVIRENNRQGGFGAKLAAGLDHVGRFIGLNRSGKMHFRSPDELEESLTRLGLTVSRNAPKGALQNVFLVAQKPSPHAVQ